MFINTVHRAPRPILQSPCPDFPQLGKIIPALEYGTDSQYSGKLKLGIFNQDFPECLESVKITMGHQNVDCNQFSSWTSRWGTGRDKRLERTEVVHRILPSRRASRSVAVLLRVACARALR